MPFSFSFGPGTEMGWVVLLDRRIAVPHPISFTLTADRPIGEPVHVTGEIDRDRHGELVVTKIAFDAGALDEGIDWRTLRSVSIPTLIEQAIRECAAHFDPESNKIVWGSEVEWPEPTPQEVKRLRRNPELPGPGDAGDGLLREVADVYREGGSRGTRAVMNEFGLTRTTAQRFIARCREVGLLGPASPRRSGEIEQDTKKPTKGRRKQ